MQNTTDTKRKITLFGRANLVELSYKTLFCNIDTTSSYAFSWEMNKSLQATLVNVCMAIQNVACFSHLCHHCWGTPPLPLCAHIHCLVATNIQQVLVNVSGCHFFLHGGVHWHTCASYALLSNAFVSECHSAAICHMAMICNGILVGRFNLFCHDTNIHLWSVNVVKQEALLLEQPL